MSFSAMDLFAESYPENESSSEHIYYVQTKGKQRNSMVETVLKGRPALPDEFIALQSLNALKEILFGYVLFPLSNDSGSSQIYFIAININLPVFPKIHLDDSDNVGNKGFHR